MTTRLYDHLVALAGEWEAQRAVIMAHEFIPRVEADAYISDWDRTPDSWDDVYHPEDRGFSTFDQVTLVSAEWIAQQKAENPVDGADCSG